MPQASKTNFQTYYCKTLKGPNEKMIPNQREADDKRQDLSATTVSTLAFECLRTSQFTANQILTDQIITREKQ